jgi:hypothetical protein
VEMDAAEVEPLDRLSDLFASDAILASQLLALRRSVPAGYRPIRRLMLAVLADGIDSLFCTGGHPRRERVRAEAARWLFDDGAAGPFSFQWVCDGLEIDSAYLREGILRIKTIRTIYRSQGL